MKTGARTILILLFLGAFLVPGFSHASFALLDGTLVKGSGPKVYFMENGIKRWITNPGIFSKFEFDWNKIKLVSDSDLSNYPEEAVLNDARIYPSGALLREKGETKVYIIKRGYRSWIEDEQSFYNLNLDWGSIFEISNEKMKRIWKISSTKKTSRILRPRTVLISTPGKVVEDINVEFDFTAETLKKDDKDIRFETFLQGVDKRWVETSRQKREIRLPKKSRKYTFFVRAKHLNEGVDLTPEKFDFLVKISPFFGDITISSIRAGQKLPENEYLYITNMGKIPISITGWTLNSKKNGREYKIPEVFEIPNYIFNRNKAKIKLNPRGVVIINSGDSTSGKGFRLNKCTGYLNNNAKFNPPLPRQCPLLRYDTNNTKNLSPSCNRIISSLARCTEPDYNAPMENECRTYLRKNAGYGNCVQNNNRYYDFFKDEWRVYFRMQRTIWTEKSDEIILRDRNRLVVNRRSY